MQVPARLLSRSDDDDGGNFAALVRAQIPQAKKAKAVPDPSEKDYDPFEGL